MNKIENYQDNDYKIVYIENKNFKENYDCINQL